jgi:hypothetical protein
VAPDMRVQLPTSSVAVRAKADPRATVSLTKPVRVHGRNLPSAIAVLARAAPVGVRPLPPGGVVLSFPVNPRKVPVGVTPFLASLDVVRGTWVSPASDYGPATGEVSTTVTHLSIRAPLDWVKSRIAALFKGGGARSVRYGRYRHVAILRRRGDHHHRRQAARGHQALRVRG